MCLIGVLYPTNGSYFLFKNRDLEYRPNIPNPQITDNNTSGFSRIIFPSTADDFKSIWGGINEFGLSMQFADIYLINDPQSASKESNVYYENKRKFLRKLHYEALATCKSVKEAYTLLLDTYANNDSERFEHIILIADPYTAVLIETTKECVAMQWLGKSGYLVRSNWSVSLSSFAPNPTDNHLCISALLRYKRAVEIIEANKSWNLDICKALLCDSLYGETGFSIRRYGNTGEYKTVSSLIVEVNEEKRICHYVLNQLPEMNKFKEICLK